MILFYSEKITPRIEYIVKLYFEQILQVKVLFTSDYTKFENTESPKINYSDQPFEGSIYLKPHPLLFETGIGMQKPLTVDYENSQYFFPSSADSFVPFDLFAAGFYIVTRYEEYVVSEKDHYGRFVAAQSILYKNKLLKKPVVNIWAEMLAAEISKNYPDFSWPARKFSFLSTIDIDNAWAYRHKGFSRTVGAMSKTIVEARFGDFFERLAVILHLKRDPNDTYSFMDSVFEGNEKLVRFFYLLGNYSRFDKNVSYRNPGYKKLIGKTNELYQVGIHPSFASAADKRGKVLNEEKERLAGITGSSVKISRQHYLKFEFPGTFRKLITAGISEDYSLGYASETGFRAGICTPFYFYDVERDIQTDLLQIPFQVMEVTLQQYLKLEPEQALKEIQNLMNEVKKVNGTFVSVWHNESVNDRGQWKGWREVFGSMNRLGFKWANE